ncbi:hypothetical protein CRG98_040492 [Punica granatum]|uniref:Uncharacterized protein n=1 Tax=Punica granatum TaxID=22663 RepID=A0A2I0I6S1_PUNGR|nr:hypothetical protein CRG98_040492 [Punica granatum]
MHEFFLDHFQAERPVSQLFRGGVYTAPMGPRNWSTLVTDFQRVRVIETLRGTGKDGQPVRAQIITCELDRSHDYLEDHSVFLGFVGSVEPDLWLSRARVVLISVSDFPSSRVRFESRNQSSRFMGPWDEQDHTSHRPGPRGEPAIMAWLAKMQG